MVDPRSSKLPDKLAILERERLESLNLLKQNRTSAAINSNLSCLRNSASEMGQVAQLALLPFSLFLFRIGLSGNLTLHVRFWFRQRILFCDNQRIGG